MSRRALWAGGLALGLGLLFAPSSYASDILTTQCDTLDLGAQEQLACLGRPFVLRSTLTLTENGRALGLGSEYLLDDRTGCVTVLTPDTVGIGRRFIATYRAAALSFSEVYRLAMDPRLRGPGPGPPALPPPSAARSFAGPEADRGLAISGSKTLGVEVGSRSDLALRQSLDVRLTGRLGRDVSLLAILSDQDIPFQPEGNTAELEQLDRVLIQLESPRAGASLGDLELNTTGFAFLQVGRRLEGFSGRAQAAGGTVRAALASAKGEFVSREFFAVEGKQGPYRLTDRTGAQGIVVVAGSERVWLDGVFMKRGGEEDYVIDYATGEITFTSRRLLTAQSLLTADYEVASSRYRRRTLFAASEGMPPRAWGSLQAAFFQEGDDASNPLGGDLSDAERELLAVLGDSAAVRGGTRYVGPGCDSCAYTLAVDPGTGRDVFVYVEAGGDYVVEFVNVGENQGDYDLDPATSGSRPVYRFVGEGRGRYITRRDMPAPQMRRIGDLRYEWSGGPGRVSVEGALSQADGNTLSPRDDGDNTGEALLVEASGKKLKTGRLTALPRARWRRVTEGFESPGRVRPGFFGRDWNLVGTETLRDENLLEGALDLNWGDALHWSGDVGRLALADTFQAVRHREDVRWTNRWARADAGWRLARDDTRGNVGQLDANSAGVVLTRWPVQPRVNATRESRRRAGQGGGERHRAWEAALGFPLGGWPFRGEVGGGRRLDDSLSVDAMSWRGVRETHTAFVTVEGAFRDVNLLLRYDARRVTEAGGPAERRDGGRLDLRHQAAQGAWRGVLTADLGTVGLARRTKSIVADSTGAFDRFGNYIGPGGGYDVVFGAPGPEDLVRRVDLEMRLRWFPPGPELRIPGWLRLAAWEGYVNLRESSALGGNFFSPGSYLDRASTLDGRLEERQVVDLWPRHRRVGLRLSQEAVRSLLRNQSSGDTSLVESRGEDQLTAVVRLEPAQGWDGEVEGSSRESREELDLGAAGRSLKITRLRAVTLRGGRQVRVERVTGRVSLEGSWNRETRAEDVAEGLILRPRVQGSLGRRSRVELRGAYTRLSRREGFTVTGPGATSLREGWRLDAVTEVRVGPGIVITGVLAVDRPRDLASTTQGRLEVRGSF